MDKSKNKIWMSKKAFLTEHRELLKTLKSRNKKKLAAEAHDQAKEVKEQTGVKL